MIESFIDSPIVLSFIGKLYFIESYTNVLNILVIFGGKTISTIPAMPIGQSGLKNGSKIMMLGKKVNAAV